MRSLPDAEDFDAAFCVGNSFGYLDDAATWHTRAVRRALRPGGRFVLETPMVLENILGHLQARPWWKVGDIHLLVENVYDASRSRLDIDTRSFATGPSRSAAGRIGRIRTASSYRCSSRRGSR